MAQESLILTEENVIAVLAEVCTVNATVFTFYINNSIATSPSLRPKYRSFCVSCFGEKTPIS